MHTLSDKCKGAGYWKNLCVETYIKVIMFILLWIPKPLDKLELSIQAVIPFACWYYQDFHKLNCLRILKITEGTDSFSYLSAFDDWFIFDSVRNKSDTAAKSSAA